jgi:AraC-like DNA-binding protein
MERAKTLLAGGDRVLDVALELGFGSGSAFARAWRRHHGRAPRGRESLKNRRGSA